MIVRTVTDITNAKVRTMIDPVDDPLSDDAIDGPDAGATLLMQHLLFIFGSFQLTAALASSISILTDSHRQTNQTAERPRETAIDRLFPIANPLDCLDINLGCVPVSIDVDAYKITWPNWAVLLPGIPSNSRFKMLGANTHD